MPNEITLLDKDASKADVFFGQKPLFTDWAYFMQNPAVINIKELTDEIGRVEPVGIGSPHAPRLFAIQQLLRLGLRRDKGLPFTTDQTCSCCGHRKIDPTLETCLYCHEEKFLLPDRIQGSHSGNNLSVLYDPKTTCWGLQYRYGYGDDKYIMWVVLGYKTRIEAMTAFYPVSLYNRWLERETKGMSEADVTDLIDLDMFMASSLPMNPVQFEQLLRKQIAAHMEEDRNYYAGVVNSAIHDYDRKHSE